MQDLAVDVDTVVQIMTFQEEIQPRQLLSSCAHDFQPGLLRGREGVIRLMLEHSMAYCSHHIGDQFLPP
eukprot:CAMPEP_0196817392 /NCGR_PEP_ID=MMETSP1362-20130617/60417_1 /TAXON_ID=163516 /ORGANISM="Leptocylindrus danicus, Strain CCMP1856" /LENGTH=68 /DNA_ID=CAMNT_0042195067 /DNA_START=1 /DNA_END=207 /DNA_ORIENTATION=-